MAWPVGLRSDPVADPLFLRAVNYGGQPPHNFPPIPIPSSERPPQEARAPRHCSPPVLRLAADQATPLARSRSGPRCRWEEEEKDVPSKSASIATDEPDIIPKRALGSWGQRDFVKTS
jgi:hypothetical protein